MWAAIRFSSVKASVEEAGRLEELGVLEERFRWIVCASVL